MRVCPLISGLGDGTSGKECDPDSDWKEESGMCWTCKQPGHRRQCCPQNAGAEVVNGANRDVGDLLSVCLSTLRLGNGRRCQTLAEADKTLVGKSPAPQDFTTMLQQLVNSVEQIQLQITKLGQMLAHQVEVNRLQ
jgi:hypothetical protein